MVRPLGLPVGSVRALLLCGLTARALLDLRTGVGDVAPWLAAGLVVSAAAYFSARAARAGWAPIDPVRSAGVARDEYAPRAVAGEAAADADVARRPAPPLWLPAGVVRTLVLLAIAYGAWLFVRRRGIAAGEAPVAVVLGAFALGVLVRCVFGWLRKPSDASATAFEHAQAFAALLGVAGLVAMAGTHAASLPSWVEPGLVAFATYYAGAR